MIDTHCHLNFKAFKKILGEVISGAQAAGVQDIIIPGTDVKTSRLACDIAASHEHLYAAVGIHPHHVFQYLMPNIQQQPGAPKLESDIDAIEDLLKHPSVVAVGEVGLDRHVYEETKYAEYAVNQEFIELQRTLLREQIRLAIKYGKSLILHNREAKNEMLPLLTELWDTRLEGRTVFHCCEPDEELLAFAVKHAMYIGVDGDITYVPEKQAFVTKIPQNMLVLETDAPYLLPEPLRSKREFPNRPANIRITAETVARLRDEEVDQLIEFTTANARALFRLP